MPSPLIHPFARLLMAAALGLAPTMAAAAGECAPKTRDNKSAGQSVIDIINESGAPLSIDFYKNSIEKSKLQKSVTAPDGETRFGSFNMPYTGKLTGIAVIAAQGDYPEMTCKIATWNQDKSGGTQTHVHTKWVSWECAATSAAAMAYTLTCEKTFKVGSNWWKTKLTLKPQN